MRSTRFIFNDLRQGKLFVKAVNFAVLVAKVKINTIKTSVNIFEELLSFLLIDIIVFSVLLPSSDFFSEILNARQVLD